MLAARVLPIVAVQVAPEDAPAVLEERLLGACTAGLRRAECASARNVSSQPQAVAMVSWLSPTQVSIEVGLAHVDPPVWLARELDFADSDPELERWRAVGFTIALLVDDERFWASLPAPDVAPPAAVAAPPAETEEMMLEGELRGLTGAGLVSGAWRVGAELRLSAMFSSLWFATLGVQYALAESDGLDVRWFDMSVGFGVWDEALFDVAPFDAMEGRLRLEIIAENVAVTARQELLSDRQNAWVPGVVLGGDLLWRIAEPWALSFRTDGFWLDGSTVVTSGGARIAASAGAGVLVGLGLRYRF